MLALEAAWDTLDRELRLQTHGVGLEVEGEWLWVKTSLWSHEVLTLWGGTWLEDGQSRVFEAQGPAQEVLLFASKSDFIKNILGYLFLWSQEDAKKACVCTTGCSELTIQTFTGNIIGRIL